MLKTSTDQRKPLPNFEHLFATTAQAPGGVARLRELILTLAVQGGLVNDEFQKIEKLKNIGDWAIGSGFPKDLQGDLNSEIPFVKVSDMNIEGNETYIEKANNYISKEVAKKHRIKVHPAGTVIFPKIGGAIATNKRRIIKIPTAIDNNCLGIIPNESITKDYLYISLQSIDMAKYQAGTSVPALSQAVLGEIEISLPPIETQSRIVTRVEELMRLCDALEEKYRLEHTQHQQLLQAMLDSLTQTTSAQELACHWQRLAQHFDLLIDRPEAVDALEQTILQLAVRGLLVPQDANDEPASELIKKIRAEKDRLIAEGKIRHDKTLSLITDEEKEFDLRAGWERFRLRDLVSHLGDGLHGTPNYSDTGEYYFVNGNNLRDGVIVIKPETKRVEKSEFEKYKKPLDKTTVLLSINGTLGNVAFYTGENVVLGKSACYFNLTSGMEKSFIRIILESPDFKKYAYKSATGSTIKNLGLKAIGDWPIALPPLAEQSRIVARVTELRALCQQLREKLTQARANQTQLAQAWLEQVAA